MNPFLALALIAGAFFFGRKTAKEKLPSYSDLPDPRQLPGIVDPLGNGDLPQLIGHVSSSGAVWHDWSGVGFEVEIYPAGIDRRTVPPPPTAMSITTSRNCGGIAVGKAWWDVAGSYAVSLRQGGVKDAKAIGTKILERYAPACIVAQTEAAILFRDEIAERVEKLLAGQSGAIAININPARKGRGGRPWSTKGARVVMRR